MLRSMDVHDEMKISSVALIPSSYISNRLLLPWSSTWLLPRDNTYFQTSACQLNTAHEYIYLSRYDVVTYA